MALAGVGARVVLAVRQTYKGAEVAAAITTAVPGAQIEVRRLDLADLSLIQRSPRPGPTRSMS